MVNKKEKLFVAVMGKPGSGKSVTWERLFNARHRAGIHNLKLNRYLSTNVYIFISSIQERYLAKDEFIKEFKKKCVDNDVNIVLCSLQTHLTGNMHRHNVITAREVLEIASKNGFDIFIQWLNPGFTGGEDTRRDVERQVIELTEINSVIGVKKENARNRPETRAEKLRTMILGWILSR